MSQRQGDCLSGTNEKKHHTRIFVVIIMDLSEEGNIENSIHKNKNYIMQLSSKNEEKTHEILENSLKQG